MAYGGGKYNDVVMRVIKELDAHGVILIVLAGNKGSGFSVAVEEGIILNVPEALRTLADEIDRDLGKENPQ